MEGEMTKIQREIIKAANNGYQSDEIARLLVIAEEKVIQTIEDEYLCDQYEDEQWEGE